VLVDELELVVEEELVDVTELVGDRFLHAPPPGAHGFETVVVDDDGGGEVALEARTVVQEEVVVVVAASLGFLFASAELVVDASRCAESARLRLAGGTYGGIAKDDLVRMSLIFESWVGLS
jgi:hypothetical protein